MSIQCNGPVLVAYAEDHVGVREALSESLNSTNVVKVIFQADNGLQLIQYLRTANPLPQVCLLDIEMPEMNGFDTAKAIKTTWPDIKILSLSGYESETFQTKMIRCGADGFLSKRSRISELTKAITCVFEDRIYNTELFEDGHESIYATGNESFEFSPVELMLLRHCGSNTTVEELGRLIGLRPKSAENQLYRLFKKLMVKNRAALIMYALKNGHIKIADF